MAYKPREIYRGRRKFRVPLTLFLFFLAGLLMLAVVIFYGLQRFLVYDSTGVTLQMPWMETEQTAEAETETESAEDDLVHPEPVYTDIVFLSPSFDDISLEVGTDLSACQCCLIEYKDVVSAVTLASRISEAKGMNCTGVILEMKPVTGYLAWGSAVRMAVDYGTGGATDYTDTVASIHAQGMTVAAQISCCADTLMASRNWTMALQSETGLPYTDSDGVYWLDPYNRTLRTYLLALCEELIQQGFDEIIFANLCHPVSDSAFGYTVTLHGDPSPRDAVCQLARSLAEELNGRETLLGGRLTVSASLNAASLRSGNEAATGQDVSVFGQLFDRLYCETDSYSVTTDAELVGSFLRENAALRFVPVFTYSAPSDRDVWALRILAD